MKCNQCPRKCGSNEQNHSSPYNKVNTDNSFEDKNTSLSLNGIDSFCGKKLNNNEVLLSKSMLHMWEEPCISGVNGSGALFFGGCNLGCSFCQNFDITNSKNPKGDYISVDNLIGEILKLKETKCHNINFVTASHFIPQIIKAVECTRTKSYDIPYLWNTSSYETVEQVKSLSSHINIYLPDLKFFDSSLSENLSNASDYFSIATKAIIQMRKQVSDNKYIKFYNDNMYSCNDSTTNAIDIIKEGLIIRHLVLPGFLKDSIKILEWIEANLSNKTTLSLLSQYIPDFYEKACISKNTEIKPSLKRKITTYEYEKVVDKAVSLGFTDIYYQKRESAQNKYIPDF